MAVEPGASARPESDDELALISRETHVDVVGKVRTVAQSHFLVIEALHLHLGDNRRLVMAKGSANVERWRRYRQRPK